jgi:hypothetical protein
MRLYQYLETKRQSKHSTGRCSKHDSGERCHVVIGSFHLFAVVDERFSASVRNEGLLRRVKTVRLLSEAKPLPSPKDDRLLEMAKGCMLSQEKGLFCSVLHANLKRKKPIALPTVFLLYFTQEFRCVLKHTGKAEEFS